MPASKITLFQRMDGQFTLTAFDPKGKILEITLGTDETIARQTADRLWSSFQSVTEITDATKA